MQLIPTGSATPVIPEEANPKIRQGHTPTPRVTTRKIGGTTFTVSSRFNHGGTGDVASKIARLIQDEAARGM